MKPISECTDKELVGACSGSSAILSEIEQRLSSRAAKLAIVEEKRNKDILRKQAYHAKIRHAKSART